MARPSKLTPELTETLVALLEAGVAIKHATKAAGIAESTYYRWREDNEEFAETVKIAEAEPAKALLTALHQKALKGDTKAATWLLERIHGYTERKTIEHAGGLELPEVPETRGAQDAARQFVASLAAASGSADS